MLVICGKCKHGNFVLVQDHIIICEKCKETIQVTESTVIFDENEDKNFKDWRINVDKNVN